MSLFRCSSCGVVENTATSHFWMGFPYDGDDQPLCSQCDPEIGKWHGLFDRTDADAAGYVSRESGHFIEMPASSTQQPVDVQGQKDAPDA